MVVTGVEGRRAGARLARDEPPARILATGEGKKRLSPSDPPAGAEVSRVSGREREAREALVAPLPRPEVRLHELDRARVPVQRERERAELRREPGAGTRPRNGHVGPEG